MSITENARYYFTSAPAFHIGITLNYLTTRFTDAGTNVITVSKIEVAAPSITGL